MTEAQTEDAPAGPATFDAPDADDARPGREVADFVARYRDGYPQKIASTGTAMVHTTYALADGDQATDAAWTATHEFHSDDDAVVAAERKYSGRGTEPHDGRSMTVVDDEAPSTVEPRDPVFIMDGQDGRVLAGCVICEERGSAHGSPGTTGTTDGSLVESTDPGSARAALSGHLRREHDRSPWPGQR